MHIYVQPLRYDLGKGQAATAHNAVRGWEVMSRPVIQKTAGRVNQKLRDSAKDCSHCMGCGLQNPNGDRLCLAHSNRLQDGKGRGLKARDDKGAILCHSCHDFVDGRPTAFIMVPPNFTFYPAAPESQRDCREKYHEYAHLKTLEWWQSEGYL